MEQSTIGIIILVISLILYNVPRIPLAMTSVLAMLSMGFFGIIDWKTAYLGFGHSAVLMIMGMMMIGGAFFTSGLATKLGNLLFKFVNVNERWFVVGVLTIGCALCFFLNGALVFALLAPIVDSITSQSKGRLTRKQAYLPLGFSCAIGNNLTAISATSMIAASGLLVASGYHRPISIFEPTLLTLPAVVAVIIFYALFGYKLQKRWFDFEEVAAVEVKSEGASEAAPAWKMWLTLGVVVAAVIALVNGVNFGAVGLLGAAVLILAGAISEKEAYRSVSWSTVILVAASIGFSQGIDKSGAGEVIAHTIINLAGPIGNSAFGMAIILMIIGTIITQVMSDNASVAILIPITLVVAQAGGWDPLPMVLAAASGVKVGIATPICVVPVTMAGAAGYRFKDYFKMGGLVTVISNVVVGVMLYFVYYI